MIPVHLRDVMFKYQAIHYYWAGYKDEQLTNELEKVTCKTCLRMIEKVKKEETE